MFEKAIGRAGSAGGPSFPVALALHGLALGAIVGSSLWSVGEPPEPPVPVTFPQTFRATSRVTASLPPAGSRKSGDPVRPARSAPLRLHPEVVAAGDATEQERPAADNVVIDIGGEGPSIDDPGDGFGVGPGGGGGPGPRTDDEIVRPGGDVRAPELLTRIDPQYPEAARKARIEGVVILDAVIAATGEVEEVRVIRSGGRLLDEAAAEAVRRWNYRPATLNGRSVRVLLTVTVSFRLH